MRSALRQSPSSARTDDRSSRGASVAPPSYGIALADRERAGGLPTPLRAGIEALSGVALDEVRVHYGSSEPAKIGAAALARGLDIHLSRGAEPLLAHEAWHVAQQARGRASASASVGGIAIDDRPALEHEAEVMGARAAKHDPAPPSSSPRTPATPSGSLAQAAYVFSYLSQQVVWSESPDSYYRAIPDFVEVEANGTKVWTRRRNVASALLYLRTQAFREDLGDETTNDSSLNARDARGITKIADALVARYPPDDYEYLFPGASGDLVAAALIVGHGVPIHRIAISDISVAKIQGLSQAERLRLDTYVNASIGPLLASRKPVLVVDALSSGASLRTFRKLITELDTKAGRQREITTLALNEVHSMAETQQVGPRQDLAAIADGGDADIIYAKKRIYKQKYKEFVPRVVPKTGLDEITAGRTTQPPASNAAAELEQQWQAYAMVDAIEQGPIATHAKDRRVRSLASHADVSPVIAEHYLSTGRAQLHELADPDLVDENEAILVKRVFADEEDAQTVLAEVEAAQKRRRALESIAAFERMPTAKHHDFHASQAAILAIVRETKGPDAEQWLADNLENVGFTWIMEADREAKLRELVNEVDDDEVDPDLEDYF